MVVFFGRVRKLTRNPPYKLLRCSFSSKEGKGTRINLIRGRQHLRVTLKVQCLVCEDEEEEDATGDTFLTPVSRDEGRGREGPTPPHLTSPHLTNTQHKTPRRHLSLRNLKKQKKTADVMSF